jgi:hypothetical protein
MGQDFKRKRLWVDPPFQGRLLARLGTYAVLYFFILWHAGFLVELASPTARAEGARNFFQLYVDFAGRNLALLVCFLLTLPAGLYDLLQFSHRVAGPLFRFRRYVDDMAAGKAVPEFHPRKNDLMRELFASFNGLIKAWNARLQQETGSGRSELTTRLEDWRAAWNRRLAENPENATGLENEVRQAFQQLADECIAELQARLAQKPEFSSSALKAENVT